MKRPLVILGALSLALLTLAVACGGDGGGDQAGIRTQKGLSVAALSEAVRNASAGEEDQNGAAPGAPSGGGGGFIAPDIFPYPMPSFQQGQDGLTVTGFGSATVPADAAIIEFYFGGKVTGVEPQPAPDTRTEPGSTGSGVSPSAPQTGLEAVPITEADLKPVVDAIVAAGVARDDVEVIIMGDPTYPSATVRATVRNIASVNAVVQAATSAAANLGAITLQGNSVSYTVTDCAALEKAAMQAAVEDARDRGAAFAQVLGVGLGSIVGASNYSYSPYGGAPCDSNFGGVIPLRDGIAYAESQASEVQLIANVSVTFAIP